MEIVKIERISNWEYSFAENSSKATKQVCRSLTFDNPNPYGFSDTIQMFDRKKLTFKIGMLSDVTEYLDEIETEYQIKDYEYSLPKGLEVDKRLRGKYKHQAAAIEAFFKRRFGIIKVPTRGGKTFIASEAIRLFLAMEKEGNVCFYVDSVDLLDQAAKDIAGFLGVKEGTIGKVGNQHLDFDRRVVVATVQTFQSILSKRCKDRKKKKALNDFLKGIKFQIIDEVHDNFSKERKKLYKKPKGVEYLLCLSATPYKKNAITQNLELKAWSGGVVYEIKEKTLRDRGVLSDYKVFLLSIDHSSIAEEDITGDSTFYNNCRSKLIFNNPVRNRVLRKVILILQRLNLKTLVLFQSVDHGTRMGKAMKIPFISGTDKGVVRSKEKDEFLEGSGGTLFASNIFKKGITLPEVEVMINADGGLEDANTVQKKGRVLGTTASKNKALIIDFMDIYELYFSDHSIQRLETYVNAIGEKKIGILDVTADDFYEVLEKWIKLWFKK